MDLNEKIAARRQELADIAEANATAKQAAIVLKAEQKLADLGIERSVTVAEAKESTDLTVNAALDSVAKERFTRMEKAIFYVLCAVGIASLLASFWLGALWLVFATVFYGGLVRRHRRVLLEDKNRSLESSRHNRVWSLSTSAQFILFGGVVGIASFYFNWVGMSLGVMGIPAYRIIPAPIAITLIAGWMYPVMFVLQEKPFNKALALIAVGVPLLVTVMFALTAATIETFEHIGFGLLMYVLGGASVVFGVALRKPGRQSSRVENT